MNIINKIQEFYKTNFRSNRPYPICVPEALLLIPAGEKLCLSKADGFLIHNNETFKVYFQYHNRNTTGRVVKSISVPTLKFAGGAAELFFILQNKGAA